MKKVKIIIKSNKVWNVTKAANGICQKTSKTLNYLTKAS